MAHPDGTPLGADDGADSEGNKDRLIRSLQAHNVALQAALNQEGDAAVEAYDSRRRLRLLVENAPLCIHEIGLDGTLQSMC